MTVTDIKLIHYVQDTEKTIAASKLLCELKKGRLSGEQNGWLSEEDVENFFKVKFKS